MGVLKEGPQAKPSAAIAFSELLSTESTYSSGFFPLPGVPSDRSSRRWGGYRVPQGRVFVSGVEVKATLHGLQKVYVNSENSLADRQRTRKEPGAAYLV